jgi:serine/threonine-protein kinase RsbT
VKGERRIPIRSDEDIVTARAEGRALAAELPFSKTDLTLITTAISEIARNMVVYAKEGEMVLGLVREDSNEGVTIVARDEGPGIEDVSLAMQDSYSTSEGLGLGLPGARRLMDEFAIESAPGTGTTVTMTKWAPSRG